MGQDALIAKASKIGGVFFGPKWPEKAAGVGAFASVCLGWGFQLLPLLGVAVNGNAAQVVFLAGTMAGTLFVGMVGAFMLGRRQWASPTRQARKLVNRLHAEWFPGQHDDLDADYRVSLWVPDPAPESPSKWLCLHRTMKATRRVWPHAAESEDLRYRGLVVYSAARNVGQSIDGIPEQNRSDPTAMKNYLARVKVSDQEHVKLSWKYASLRSSIVRSDTGAVSAVLLVERESGQRIQVQGKEYWVKENGDFKQVDVLAAELALVASIWSAAIASPEGTP